MRQRIPARSDGVAGNRNSPWEARRVSNGEDMMLPKIRGLDASKALSNDPATAGIAVVACTGWSQKNAGRRQQDVACAFLDIAELGLDEGCEALLVRWRALCAG